VSRLVAIAATIAAACLAAGSLAACSLPTGEVVTYTSDMPELAGASVSAEGVWESAPWQPTTATPWIEFGPRLTVELEHTLGYAPRVVLIYIAFDPQATDPAAAAGDLGRVVDVSDTFVAVKNDTNATYFVRVVAF
jgi:hypothetical protein